MIRSRARSNRRRANRQGLAAVELAFLLPLLVFMCMAAIDFARVVYALVSLQNCARNGALYEFYKASGQQLPSNWAGLSMNGTANPSDFAVQCDQGNLSVNLPATYGGNPNPYSPAASTNNYVTVTVQCNFTLLMLGSNESFPSIGQHLTLTQSVSMPMPANAPAP